MISHLAAAVAWMIGQALSFLPNGTSSPLSIEQSGWGALVDGIAIMGEFVNLSVLAQCLGMLFAWRLVWLVYRGWIIVLHAIPLLG